MVPVIEAVRASSDVIISADTFLPAVAEAAIAAGGVASILNGVRILRMHNVPAASSAIRMTEAILGWREPAYLRHNMGDATGLAATGPAARA